MIRATIRNPILDQICLALDTRLLDVWLCNTAFEAVQSRIVKIQLVNSRAAPRSSGSGLYRCGDQSNDFQCPSRIDNIDKTRSNLTVTYLNPTVAAIAGILLNLVREYLGIYRAKGHFARRHEPERVQCSISIAPAMKEPTCKAYNDKLPNKTDDTDKMITSMIAAGFTLFSRLCGTRSG